MREFFLSGYRVVVASAGANSISIPFFLKFINKFVFDHCAIYLMGVAALQHQVNKYKLPFSAGH